MRKRAEKHPEVTETPIKESKTISKVQKNVEVVAKRHDQTEEEKREKIPKSSELNERGEKAVARTDKMEKALMAPKKKRLDFYKSEGCCLIKVHVFFL